MTGGPLESVDPDPAPRDGRTLRSERTRTLVVEAFLDLLESGEAQPTAQRVSDRCGVSMRSIFRLFDDVEALHVAAVAAQTERAWHLAAVPPTEGDLTDRIRGLAQIRADLFEAISPVRAMATRLAPTSPPITSELARADRLLRRQVDDVFTRELSVVESRERRDALDALDLLFSWETWDRLRHHQPVSRQRAVAIIAAAAQRTLEPTAPSA